MGDIVTTRHASAADPQTMRGQYVRLTKVQFRERGFADPVPPLCR